MRVLYLSNSAQIGGGNRQLQSLWDGMRPRGLDASAVCPAAGPMADLCRENDIPVEILDYPQPAWRSPLATWSGYRRCQRLLQRTKPDLVHANDFIPARSLAVAAKRSGVPLLCHVHFPVGPDGLRWMFRGLPKPAAFVYNSGATRQICEPVLAKTCPRSAHFLVYNCVSSDRFFPSPRREERLPFRVGIIANLMPVKGHKDFLEMARLLTARRLDLEYWIIGADIHGSGFGAELEAHARALGLEQRVRFLGHRPDVPDLVRELDVVVCASHDEPFGLCLIEAMACEVPVVATRVGGIPEVVESEVTGFVVAPRAPQQLAEKVETLLANPALRQQMGAAGRERVQSLFSPAAHASRMQEVYAELRRGSAGC